jgi:hypothetical protein
MLEGQCGARLPLAERREGLAKPFPVLRLNGGALRLRWQEDREFWTRLVRAARDGDGETLADIHLHAGRDVKGPSGGNKIPRPQDKASFIDIDNRVAQPLNTFCAKVSHRIH